MLEVLLLAGALSGGPEVQSKTLDAYARYSGINTIIEDFGNKNPTVAFLVGSVGLIRSKKLYYGIRGPFYHELYADGNGVAQTIWLKVNF